MPIKGQWKISYETPRVETQLYLNEEVEEQIRELGTILAYLSARSNSNGTNILNEMSALALEKGGKVKARNLSSITCKEMYDWIENMPIDPRDLPVALRFSQIWKCDDTIQKLFVLLVEYMPTRLVHRHMEPTWRGGYSSSSFVDFVEDAKPGKIIGELLQLYGDTIIHLSSMGGSPVINLLGNPDDITNFNILTMCTIGMNEIRVNEILRYSHWKFDQK